MAYTAPKVAAPKVKAFKIAQPGKPKPQKPTTISNGKSTQDSPKSRWPGLTKRAGSNFDPNHPSPTGWKSQQAIAKAVASAKSHAAADTAPAGDVVGSDRWLADLTPAQLKKQAVTTISAAYKPSFGDLNSEQKQLAALNAKRAQDDTAYQNWASGQEQSILAQGTAADANFAAASSAANTALANAAPSSAALVAQANDRQGNVSDNSTSTQLGAGGTVDQNTARVNATNDIGSVENLANVQNSGDLLRSDAINVNSRIGDNEASQAATAQQQLTAIGTQRSKLQLSKAGDIEKEIARLQGVEIQKAQNAQQEALAEQTLGANTANQQATAANNAASIAASVKIAGIDAKKYFAGLNNARAIAKYEQLNENQRAKLSSETSLTEAQQRAALSNKEYLLNVKKVGIAKASTIWKEQHPNAGSSSSSAHSGNPGGSPLTANEQNEDYAKVHGIVGTLNGLFPHYPTGPGGVKGGDTAVYQALANGTSLTYTGSDGKPVTITAAELGGPYPPELLNAAFDLSQFRAGKGGLSPRDIAKLRSIGLRNVTQHLG